MHPSCAQETLLHLRILRILRVLQSLNSDQIQQDQLLLIIRNTFLVLVLGFHAVCVDCRDKDSSQIICAGVVLDFQILQIQIGSRFSASPDSTACCGRRSMYQLQYSWRRQRTESRSSRWTHITVCRQNLRVNHHSTSV